MTGQRIKDETTTSAENLVLGADGEQGTYLATLRTLASDLDSEFRNGQQVSRSFFRAFELCAHTLDGRPHLGQLSLESEEP